MLLIVLMYAFLASIFVLGKAALAYSPPAFLVSVRMLLGGALLLFFYRVVQGRKTRVAFADFGLLLLTSLFHIYLSMVPEYWALQYLAASKATLLNSMKPFMTALLAYGLYKERLSGWQCLGMVVGFVSLLPVVLLKQVPGELNGNLWTLSLPELVLFGSILTGAYAWFLVRKLMRKGYSPILINGIAMVMGGTMALAHGWFTYGFYPLAPGTFLPFMGYIMLLILIGNVVYFNAYAWMIQKYGITEVAIFGFLSPVFGGFFGWLFLGEQITWHYVVSLAGIAYGMRLFFKK